MSTPDDAFVVFLSTRPSSAAPQTKRLWLQSNLPATTEAVEIEYASGTDLQDPYVVGSHIYFVEGGKVRVGELVTTGAKPRIDNARDALTVASADHPVVSADELEMFYASSDGALHRTTRAASGTFAAGPALTGQNAMGNPSYLTPDGCALYFTSSNLPFRSIRPAK
jgi:hypothetical protein